MRTVTVLIHDGDVWIAQDEHRTVQAASRALAILKLRVENMEAARPVRS